jgi:uncharacterized protein YndB with AHSA1/START domain
MIGRLIRLLIRLAPIAATGAWLADRWLRDRAESEPPAGIRSTVVVAAPIAEAWRLLAEIERQPEWMHDLKRIDMETPPPHGVGARGVGTVRILGISVADPVEVTEFDPPHHYAIRHEGLFTGGGVITLEEGADGATIVTWDEQLIAPVLPHLAAVIQGPVFGRIFQADLDRFARLVEAEASVA